MDYEAHVLNLGLFHPFPFENFWVVVVSVEIDFSFMLLGKPYVLVKA